MPTTTMRSIFTIAFCTILAGACDMPTDTEQNDEPIETDTGAEEGSSSESGDLPIVNPEPEDPSPSVLVGDYVLCSDLPDRTAYAVHFDNPWKCHVLFLDITWEDILTPGYEVWLNQYAETKRDEWGVLPETEMLAAYRFDG